jgi:thioredoxin-related protein
MVLLRVLAAAFTALAATAFAAAEPSPHAIHIPSWFATSFLDFRDEVKDAAAQGRRVMVYFGQDGCPYCARLMQANFSQRDIVETTRARFVAIEINMWGDRETVWTDGVRRPEKELAAFLRVQFTPTLVFLDETGATALRLNGYYPPERFRIALEFASRPRAAEENFAEFLRARSGEARPKRAAPTGLFREPPATIAFPRKGAQLLFFESPDCSACEEMRELLARPEMRSTLTALDPVRVNAFGGRKLGHVGGEALPESEWARKLGVSFTPTLVFFDAEGREVFRGEGHIRRFHVASALEYVAQGAYRTEPSFQRFLQARAERERAAGRSVDLLE